MELEKNEEIELIEYLKENDFPQSCIELIEDYYKDNLLTMIKR